MKITSINLRWMGVEGHEEELDQDFMISSSQIVMVFSLLRIGSRLILNEGFLSAII